MSSFKRGYSSFLSAIQHTLATERGPRAPLVFYIEARSLDQNRTHHRGGRFGRQVISLAWGDKELYVEASESHGLWLHLLIVSGGCVVSWPATQIQWTGTPQQQRSTIFTQLIFPRHRHHGMPRSRAATRRPAWPRGGGQPAGPSF